MDAYNWDNGISAREIVIAYLDRNRCAPIRYEINRARGLQLIEFLVFINKCFRNWIRAQAITQRTHDQVKNSQRQRHAIKKKQIDIGFQRGTILRPAKDKT
jgi:hypothetical protein